MGVQISCCIYSEIQKEDTVFRTTGTFGGSVPGVSQAQGVRDIGGSCDGRSCTHDDIDPTEVFSGPDDWLYQREERNSYSSHVPRS